MHLGAITPIKESDLDVPSIAKNTQSANKHTEGMHSELSQIKWILVVLALIILLKKN